MRALLCNLLDVGPNACSHTLLLPGKTTSQGRCRPHDAGCSEACDVPLRLASAERCQVQFNLHDHVLALQDLLCVVLDVGPHSHTHAQLWPEVLQRVVGRPYDTGAAPLGAGPHCIWQRYDEQHAVARWGAQGIRRRPCHFGALFDLTLLGASDSHCCHAVKSVPSPGQAS